MSAGATATLVADGGASAASGDFFRCRAYLEAEGVTHTMRIESPNRVTLVPLIVREIEPGGRLDAISPYGYPGGTAEGAGTAPESSSIDCSATGLVSVFLRERLAEPALAGGRTRSRIQAGQS